MADLAITRSAVRTSAAAILLHSNLAGEEIAAGDFVYYDAVAEEWLMLDAAIAAGAAPASLRGFAQNHAHPGQPLCVAVSDSAYVAGGTLTVGARYFASTTPGAIFLSSDLSVGDYPILAGVAISTTELAFETLATGSTDAGGGGGGGGGSDLSITPSDVIPSAAARLVGGIAAVTVTAGEFLIYDEPAALWRLLDATSASHADPALLRGLSANGAAAGQPITVILSDPELSIGNILVQGTRYFASDTAGKLMPESLLVSGLYPILAGIAVSATVLAFQPASTGTALP